MIFPVRTLPVLSLIVVAAALGGGAMALMPLIVLLLISLADSRFHSLLAFLPE